MTTTPTQPRRPAFSITDLVPPDDPVLHPALTERQLREVAALAHCREYAPGEVMFEQGQRNAPLIVLESGSVDIYDRTQPGDTLIARVIAGRFVGDLAMFTGEPTLAECVASEPVRALIIDQPQVRRLIAQQPDVGDLILRTLIARREWLSGHGLGQIKLIGSRWSEHTFRLRDFLSRNQVLFRYYDLDSDPEVDGMLKAFGIDPADTPVLICPKGVHRNPTVEQVAENFGLRARLDESKVVDLLVVGAGPGGLASAVYGGSEGLDTLVIEADSPGGQAGTSSRIENYLGFPMGVSGDDLTQRAVLQARKFGVTLTSPRTVDTIDCEGMVKRVRLSGGEVVTARSVVVAVGVDYRKLPCPDCERYDGRGVYYGASHQEAEQCRDETVVVVGGGNSAGQAAINLAQTAAHVLLVIRRDSLAESMSRYLIDRIDRADNIELVTETQLTGFVGEGGLKRVTMTRRDGGESKVETSSVFVMIGADPRTDWLRGCVGLDDRGFIVTGEDARHHPDFADHWGQTNREPFLLETTRPGIFAVGDVRSGSIKRVASAVGEGSMAVKYVHEHLAVV
ncbi:MAG: FAD-dependent oxidoreductase [Planctomycetota bacterium]